VSSPGTTRGIKRLPDGYVAVPITDDQKLSVLKICVLVRSEPDPAGGHLIVLRNTVDAKIFLGCIVDASNQVLDWLELWMQNSASLINTPAASRLYLSNATLDDRWNKQFQAFEQLNASEIVRTGMENSNPLPTLINVPAGCPVHPMDPESGTPWKLCKDEGLLQQNGLPGYGSTLHRYLYVPASGSASKFVPVTPGAPMNESTKPLSEMCADDAHTIPFNIAAGLMLVKKHEPIDLETYINILSGISWDGLKHGRSILDFDEQINALRKDETALTNDGRLFLETSGRHGRLIETLHLKLRLLADVISSVHTMVCNLQCPLLNISPESWQVKLGEVGRGLPFLWTAKAILSNPGDAIQLTIKDTNLQYYLPSPAAGTSIYRPLVSSVPIKGRASVRIRSVLSEANDTTVVEGTFSTQERIEIASHDIAWLRINLACGDVDLYAHLESDSAMASGEWRFRTAAQNLKHTEDLKATEGVPMPEVQFEIIPLLSSPCDLYSLAVLAIRIFLVDNTNSLPVALDETMSLMRQVEADFDKNVSIEERISDLFCKDNRWLESLGPQHLTFDDISSDEIFRIIPPGIWWAILLIIMKMLSGLGPDSECRDYGDAQPGGLHKVFERTMDDIDKLILKTRSLIVSDRESNQEIAAVIQTYLT
jgi:hypothetical protein